MSCQWCIRAHVSFLSHGEPDHIRSLERGRHTSASMVVPNLFTIWMANSMKNIIIRRDAMVAKAHLVDATDGWVVSRLCKWRSVYYRKITSGLVLSAAGGPSFFGVLVHSICMYVYIYILYVHTYLYIHTYQSYLYTNLQVKAELTTTCTGLQSFQRLGSLSRELSDSRPRLRPGLQ